MAQGKPSTAQALQLAQSCASVLGIVRPIAYCQEAGFIIVSYHLIANMNTVVAKMRRAAIKEASYEDLQLLKKTRYFCSKVLRTWMQQVKHNPGTHGAQPQATSRLRTQRRASCGLSTTS